MDLVEGVDGEAVSCGHGDVGLGCAWGHGLADLDQVGVAVEAEGFAAFGGDVAGGPGGVFEEGDVGVADGLEAGEAVLDLGVELGCRRLRRIGEGEGDGDAVFWGTPGILAPGASGSGVMVMERTRPRSTMLQGMTGS